ncbi:uncharacterized protein LOC117603837 [Osmia lignaria lignaria]|uniref:uncharacterized protein LOC117603837 n=1 Tax=Osmia lignaria lignaria TaxID=1437193 RepID=UPI0014781120|nr:uncharacterized protein LOC117603837 [Osmia lignaria]
MRPKNRGYWPEPIEVDQRKKQESLAARGKNNTNPEQNLLRRQDQKSTVTDLVYKYLRKVAYTDCVRKQRNNACSKFRKGNARRKTIHPPRRYTSAENSEVKSYLRKALSFAIDSGYLIPTDRTGKFLRISPNMLNHEE